MQSARDTLREVMKHRSGRAEDLLRFIEQNETAVSHIMNFLEEMATCCRHQVVDVAIMKDQFDYVIVSVWDTLFVWIRKQRQETANFRIWEDTESLYDMWKRH